jgi:hypothetical protein
MRRLVVALFVSSLVLSMVVGAEQFKLDNLSLGEKNLKASDKASGELRWQSKTMNRKTQANGRPMIYIREDGAGLYGKDKNYKTWRSELYYYLEGNRAIPYQTNIVYKDKSGKIINTITKYIDAKNRKVVFRNNQEDREYPYYDDLIDKEFLGTAAANYDFAGKKDFLFHLFTNEPRIYPITLKYIGEETITQGGKEVRCYKVQMIPDLGALNIIGAFVPKTYFWYRTDAPHAFVRYEGLESGLGTPYIVIQEE